MNKDEIESKFELMSALTEELDGLVWKALKDYLEASGGCFSDPEAWYMEDGCIVVTGTDGCWGSYESCTEYLELGWVLDPEGMAERIKEERRVAKELREKNREERVKYISRWRAKGGIDDLRKVVHYTQILIERELNEKTASKDEPKKPSW